MTGLEMRYFVLKPKGDDVHAIASRNAMRAYANYIHFSNPKLASDLEAWADRETAATIEGKITNEPCNCEQCYPLLQKETNLVRCGNCQGIIKTETNPIGPLSRDEIIQAIARETWNENVEPHIEYPEAKNPDLTDNTLLRNGLKE